MSPFLCHAAGMKDMPLRLVIAGVLLGALALLFGNAPVLLAVAGICLLAGLIGYATQDRRETLK